MSDFKRDLQAHADAIEALLLELLPTACGQQARLHEAMRYATLDGGKRLRPFLVAGGARLFGVPEHQALRVGVAIELIHGYSLVHDDLPAMDDAALRRGTRVLPQALRRGDRRARRRCAAEPGVRGAGIKGDPSGPRRARRAGSPARHRRGCCRHVRRPDDRSRSGNQAAWLRADGAAATAQDRGALFRFASQSGAVLGGASTPEQAALAAYADDLGLAFQIKDDLLDIQGDPALAGKALGQDAEAGKATLVALLGADEAEQRLAELQASALHHLERFGCAGRSASTTFRVCDRSLALTGAAH